MTDLLWTRPDDTPIATVLLAHGSGAPMDSPFMNRIAALYAQQSIAVARFEFPYMADRRVTGKKRPPPRADKLLDSYQEAIAAVAPGAVGPLLIGGKSLGGRVAVMASGDPALDPHVVGIVCLGYPFHPPAKPEATRLAPLQAQVLPCLIAQGERDAFGNRDEVGGYALPDCVEVMFLEDGSHDLAPRGSSPATWEGNLRRVAEETRRFALQIAQ